MADEADAEAVADKLAAAALGPQAVTVDGRTTQAQPLPNLIQALDALDARNARKAAKGKPLAGLTFVRMIPGRES